MRLNVGLLGVYLLALALSFLAGIYFGALLFVFFFFILLFPVFSVLTTWVAFASVRVSDTWDNPLPVRGDSVRYNALLENPSVLPVADLSLGFHHDADVPDTANIQDDLVSVSIAARSQRRESFEIICRKRGAFSVGVASISAVDMVRMISMTKRRECPSLMVHPRIYQLSRFSTVVEDIRSSFGTRGAGGSEDPSLFMQLREYREGESIRHIFWRKYASTGKPFLREYESQQKTSVELYVDVEPAYESAADAADQTDTSVEIYLALAKYFLENRVPTAIQFPGGSGDTFSGNAPEHFDLCYRQSVELAFDSAISAASVLRNRMESDLLETRVPILVTHRPDAEFFALVESPAGADVRAVINLVGAAPALRQKTLGRLSSTGTTTAEIYIVENPNEIPQKLGRLHYAGRSA